jgi:DNA-directed RNA polymerase specialized sigma24 family protein
LQLGRRLRGKVEPSDLVQEAFLEAHRDFDAFRGTISAELLSWLRRVLVHNLANQVRRFQGTRRRDVRLQRELAAELEQSSQALARGRGWRTRRRATWRRTASSRCGGPGLALRLRAAQAPRSLPSRGPAWAVGLLLT